MVLRARQIPGDTLIGPEQHPRRFVRPHLGRWRRYRRRPFSSFSQSRAAQCHHYSRHGGVSFRTDPLTAYFFYRYHGNNRQPTNAAFPDDSHTNCQYGFESDMSCTFLSCSGTKVRAFACNAKNGQNDLIPPLKKTCIRRKPRKRNIGQPGVYLDAQKILSGFK